MCDKKYIRKENLSHHKLRIHDGKNVSMKPHKVKTEIKNTESSEKHSDENSNFQDRKLKLI